MNRYIACSSINTRPLISHIKRASTVGGITGVIVQFCTFPLETILTKVMVNGHTYTSAYKDMVQKKEFWHGASSPLIGAGLRRGITLTPIEIGKHYANTTNNSVFWFSVFGASIGGLLESTVTTVTERKKTLIQTTKSDFPSPNTQGLNTLQFWYRGFVPNATKNIISNPVLFAMSPYLKTYMPEQLGPDINTFLSTFLVSFLTQLWGVPLERCRALMQAHPHANPVYAHLSCTQTIVNMYTLEGFKGIMTGYGLRSARTGLMSGLTMTLYPRIECLIDHRYG